MNEETTGYSTGSTKRKRLTLFISTVGLLLIASTIGIWWFLEQGHSSPTPMSPVPKTIASSVSFSIYYPEQSKLPAGYTLDLNSFKQPVRNGVNYTVSYSNGHKLVFSLQPKPSATELQNFSANYIPLHITYHTSIGQALLGAYNTKTGTETLVSLPANGSSTWIILTAPYDINQDQLKQVLSALRRN